jgi:hypothetical protein
MSLLAESFVICLASKKFWALMHRKHPNVAVVAVARELCGFM